MLGSNPVADRLRHRGQHYLLLTTAALVLFFWNLGSATLWDIDEGRNVTCAVEMFLSGNWIVPTFNDVLRPDKPALLYWLQIIGFHLVGVNEWAGRLPSAFAALGTLFVVYELARRMFSKSTALLAGIVLATTPMFVGASRFANPDALLSAFTTLTLYLFWRCQERPATRWFLFAGAASGLAVLAKGPVGVALPGVVIVLYLTWEGRLRLLVDRRVGWAILAFLIVAVPWYLKVGLDTRWEWPKRFFFEHHVARVTGPMEGHGGSVLYYPLVLIAGTMPWSIFLGGAIVATFWSSLREPTEPVWPMYPNAPTAFVRPSSWLMAVWTYSKRIVARLWWGSLWLLWGTRFLTYVVDFLRRRFLRVGGPGNATWRRLHDPAGRGGVAAYRFLAVWALTYLVCFSLSATKLPNYVLPMTMPTAILIARLVDRWRRGLIEAPGWCRSACLAMLALIGIGLGVGFAIAGGLFPGTLKGPTFPALAPFALLGAVPIAATVVLTRLTSLGRRDAATAVFALQAALFLAPLAACMSVALNAYKSPASLVADSGLRHRDVDLRLGAYATEHIPSLNFYSGRDVTPILNVGDLARFLRQPILAYVVISEENLAEFRRSYADVGHESTRHFDMYRRQAMVVLSNE
jgi:4-amino-4-deoxy-L-arabinose transferase-like glycosyltransferase